MISLYAGLTSQTIDLFIQDSSSTTGAGKTGLAYNTSGLAICYRKGATGSFTAITLATQTVGGAWSSGGFVELDSTNAAGTYRLDIPNAAIDTAGFVTLYVKGTGIASAPVRIDCRPLPGDVRQFGGTAGTFSGGRPEVNATHVAGTAQTARDLGASVIAASVTAGVTLAATTHTGAVIPTVTTLTNLPSITPGWLTATGIAASALNGKGDWNTTTPPTAGAISTQVASDLATAHGAGSWATATGFSTLTAADIRTAVGMASANLDAQLSAIKTDTAVARSAGVVQIGVISNAGTAVESYTYGGQTVTFAGLDSSGNRSGVTVT